VKDHLSISTNGVHKSVQQRAGSGRTGSAKATAADPRISIIIPALNEEKLIERTLGCFPAPLRERFGIELIVSDGGSSDSTVAIARGHRATVVEHREKRRQTIAEGRNRGAEAASGELLVFINADTMPRDPAAFLQELNDIASGLEERTVAIACPVEIAPEERKLSDRLFHGFFNNYVRLLNLVGVGMGRGECQVVRRDAFRQVGGYQNHMAAGEDFDLYKRLTKLGRIGHRSSLSVYESPRRFRRYGYLLVLAEWTLNALAVLIIGRSISKEWEEIR
jgi:glycosyltransferase involved in cell wall biosynthesis